MSESDIFNIFKILRFSESAEKIVSVFQVPASIRDSRIVNIRDGLAFYEI